MSALGIGRDDPADQDRSDLAEAICEMAIQDEPGVADARIRYPVTVKDGVVYEVTGMAEVRYVLGGRDDTYWLDTSTTGDGKSGTTIAQGCQR